METSKLTGPALDWAVAKCKGYAAGVWAEDEKVFVVQKPSGGIWMLQGGSCLNWLRYGRWNPAEDWEQGGPIIEREGMTVTDRRHLRPAVFDSERWRAETAKYVEGYGPTPLIAAMRCYVASKLGDEVEIPEELR